MTELEIEANLTLKAEWDTIQESGKKLTPLFGPGNTGMVNLGNRFILFSFVMLKLLPLLSSCFCWHLFLVH